MKKNILYIALAAMGGLLAGYLFFGDTFGKSENQEDTHNHQVEDCLLYTSDAADDWLVGLVLGVGGG